MDSVLQVLKEFGVPLGMMVVAVWALWRENRRLQTKIEGLYDRLTVRPTRNVDEGMLAEVRDELAAVTACVDRLERAIARKVKRADPVDRADTADRNRTDGAAA